MHVMIKKTMKYKFNTLECRAVFRTLPNIYGEVFLQFQCKFEIYLDFLLWRVECRIPKSVFVLLNV